MQGKLPALPGELPRIGDWGDHVTTAFPEVRLKSYLEMRGADGGPWRRLCALPALWVGLFYDSGALDAACGLVADWTEEEREAMRRDVPRLGLDTPHRSRTLRDIGLEVLEIAREGLHRRARRDQCGEDETHYLDTLFSIAGSGRTPAEELIEDYKTRWNGDINRVYDEYSY
jgi:glutamate--cysteine ligase